MSDLKPGQRRRISERELVSFNGTGWQLYNFGEKQAEVYAPEQTLAEKLEVIRLRRVADDEATATATLPMPAMYHTRDWPAPARTWLYSAGFNNDTIHAQLGAYWNPSMQRVILPYITAYGQPAWIARRINGGGTAGPKYLFPRGVPRGGGAVVHAEATIEPSVAVITEDLLSATRVAHATGFLGVAAQGTSLDRDAVIRLAKRVDEVIVWLDPDVWGRRGALSIREQFANIGVPVRDIKSDSDPKFYSDDVIRELVQ